MRNKSLTQEEFIQRAKEVHGEAYDYSKVEYKTTKTKICIICPTHGEFWQTPNNHLSGCGCPNCRGKNVAKRLSHTTDNFTRRAKEVHGEKYDYSKVEYVNNYTKVCIICPTHGEFWQRPSDHLRVGGCPECSLKRNKREITFSTKKMTLETFIEKAKQIHGDKYDYSKVEYINSSTKVCIICPEHGEFWQLPSNHIHKTKSQGCPMCGREQTNNSKKKTLDHFLKKAQIIHGDKYDYSKVEYKGSKEKVCIICPKHGEFWQVANNHVHKTRPQGCPYCFEEKQKTLYNDTTEEFITKAIKIHGDKYDYSRVDYINNHTKICIICPTHGEFWQTPDIHLSGCGCPKCKMSKIEKDIIAKLEESNIIYNYRDKKTLNGLELDFYLPQYNVGIECQGIQHFAPIDFAGRGKEWANETFKGVIERDEHKRQLCNEKGIKLLYYSNLGIEYPYTVYENNDKLLKEITNINKNEQYGA